MVFGFIPTQVNQMRSALPFSLLAATFFASASGYSYSGQCLAGISLSFNSLKVTELCFPLRLLF